MSVYPLQPKLPFALRFEVLSWRAVVKNVFLVVDDHAPFRTALARSLRPYGEVRHAASVAEGKEMALKTPWTALFIDVTLPDGNGLDVLGYARANGCMAPALVLTASHDPATIHRAFDSRARFMMKPGDWSDIEDFVRAALAAKHD